MRGSPFSDDVAQTGFETAERRGKLPVFYYDTSLMIALFPAAVPRSSRADARSALRPRHLPFHF
jgi:hypothetical protein